MIRSIAIVTTLAALVAGSPAPTQAQILIGPEVAWNDAADFGVGAGIEFDLPELYPGV